MFFECSMNVLWNVLWNGILNVLLHYFAVGLNNDFFFFNWDSYVIPDFCFVVTYLRSQTAVQGQAYLLCKKLFQVGQ